MLRELYCLPNLENAALLSNVAASYNELGRVNKALELKEESLKVLRELYCLPHLENAGLLSNVANSHSELGQVNKALEFQE